MSMIRWYFDEGEEATAGIDGWNHSRRVWSIQGIVRVHDGLAVRKE